MLIKIIDLFALSGSWLLITLMEILPEKSAYALSRFCIFLLHTTMPHLDKVAIKNLEMVFPEKSKVDQRIIIKKSYDTLAKNLLYFAKLTQLNKEKIIAINGLINSIELARTTREENPKVGTLFLVPHFGCFELFAQVWTLANRPFGILARGFGLPRTDAWWNKRRNAHGSDVFARKDGFHEVIRRLNNGKDVAFLFDQNVKKNYAVFTDLLGIKAATTKTMAIAAIRTGCPLIFGALIENADGSYTIHSERIKIPENITKNDEKIFLITSALNKSLENLIRKYPEQWFWIHRRFKTRPQGEKEDLYSEI